MADNSHDDVAAALAAANQNLDPAAQLAAAAQGDHPATTPAPAASAAPAEVSPSAATAETPAAAAPGRFNKLRSFSRPALWRSNPGAPVAAALALLALALALIGLIGFLQQRAPWGLLWPSFWMAVVAACLGLVARGKVVRDEVPGKGAALTGVLAGAVALPLLLVSVSLARLGVVPAEAVERPRVAHKSSEKQQKKDKDKGKTGSDLEETKEEPAKDEGPKGIAPGAVERLGPDQPELQDVQLAD